MVSFDCRRTRSKIQATWAKPVVREVDPAAADHARSLFSRARLCQSRRFIGDWNPQRTLKAKRDLLLDGEFICYELRNLPNICSRRSFAVGLTGVSRPSVQRQSR